MLLLCNIFRQMPGGLSARMWPFFKLPQLQHKVVGCQPDIVDFLTLCLTQAAPMPARFAISTILARILAGSLFPEESLPQSHMLQT